MLPVGQPNQFLNISTRAVVGTGDNAMIAGFIIRSDASKKVIVRALGPSLNVPNKLANPYLEITDSAGHLIANNDDWRNGQQQEVMASGLDPANDLESAIVLSLPDGNYTARVRSANGETGIGVVEVYDLGVYPADTGRFANLSTRGRVGRGDDVLIGGIILRGFSPAHVIVRAIGPDLAAYGVTDALQDPVLELRNQFGVLLASNDDWPTGSLIPPNDSRDAVIDIFLYYGNYTAVVQGKNGTTGLALVEFYDLKQ